MRLTSTAKEKREPGTGNREPDNGTATTINDSSKFKVPSSKCEGHGPKATAIPVPSSQFPVPAVVGFTLETAAEIRNLRLWPGQPVAMSGPLEKGIA
jgi:hypothetical protein